MHEGKRGVCFVREVKDGELVTDSYGRASGFMIDPIEKKPLFHFLPGTPVLSFGTMGCNLTCAFCQNWKISRSHDLQTLGDAATPEQIAAAAVQLGCRSVAFTYNEPIIFHEYAVDVAKACHAVGVKTIAVTAGYQNAAPRAEFYEHIDAANIDLKAFTDRFYREICGGHLEPVLETIEYVHRETKAWLELTTLLIPGENDSDSEIQDECSWIAGHLGPNVPVHFTAFHPDWRMRNRIATPYSVLSRARRIARATGLHFVYTGNVHDIEGSSTYCAACNLELIERNGYEIDHSDLTDDGHCRRCATRLPGLFEGQPGHWGARFESVTIGTAAPTENHEDT